MVKNSPANARDTGDAGLIPGWGKSLVGGNDNALQYSCMGNSRQRRLADYSPRGDKESDMN